jgi:hypothetical protein
MAVLSAIVAARVASGVFGAGADGSTAVSRSVTTVVPLSALGVGAVRPSAALLRGF